MQKYFLNFQDHQYYGVSSFMFLRFLVPAVMYPKLFYLQDTHPSKCTSRTLLLLGKIILSIGNMKLPQKDYYLEPMTQLIQHYNGQLKNYIDELVNMDIKPRTYM